MNKLSPGDLVRLRSGGPVMTVEADRGGGNYTYTWITNEGSPRSLLLQASMVVAVEAEAEPNRLPQAIVGLEDRVTAIEEKILTRGYDTRPMYEVHEKKIQELEARVEELQRSHNELETTTKKLREVGEKESSKDGGS
jgi:uncharacterized protein YodC (DUF2158 family)